MSLNCSSSNCNNKLYNNEHCIFHCTKDDWYTVETIKNYNNKMIESRTWNTKLLEQFWDEFDTYIINNNNCKEFIFPESEYYIFENNKYKDIEQRKHLENKDFLKINFDKAIFIESVSINKTIINCTFKGTKFNYLDLSFTKIKDCNFHGANIKDLSIQAALIEDSSFKWLNANTMSLMYSHVYNTHFDSASIDNMDLLDVVIKDVSFQNIHLLKGDKDTYRVLKDYYFNISDNLKGNYFYAKEMQEYCKQIMFAPYYDVKQIVKDTIYTFKNKKHRKQKVKNIYNNFKYLFISLKTVITEGLLLTFNFLMSNYGQNWFLPLMWLVIFSLTIFISITPDKVFDVNEFAMFLNPFIKNTDKYNDVYAIWLLHKIMETIFIYNFIVAIKRKTNK